MKNADWDAVIVGAGAGGAAAAYGLCRRGLSVLLLEAGPQFDPINDYPLTASDWELRAFPEKPGSTAPVTFAPGQKLGTEPLLASASRGMGPVVTSGTRWMEKYHHVRGVGGTTLHFTGESHRMHPEAMKMKSRFGVAADWPIDYAELEPFYIQAEELDRRRWTANPRGAVAVAPFSFATASPLLRGPNLRSRRGGTRPRLAGQQPRSTFAVLEWTAALQLLWRLQRRLSARR